jgi:tetratricopeptide (TPR) repeat protein
VRHLPESQTEIPNKLMRPPRTHYVRMALIALSPILLLGTILVLWINSTGWIPYSLGVMEHNLTHYEQAIDYFDWAIKSNPKWADAYDYRAQARMGLGSNEEADLERAIADASKAIALDPTKPGYYETRALAYESAEKFKEAIADYSHRLNMTSAVSHTASETIESIIDPWLPQNRVLESRAGLYEKLGDWKNARADRQKLIDQYTREIENVKRLERNNPSEKGDENRPPYEDRGEQYANIGEFEKALQDYTLAIKSCSDLFVGPVYALRADLEVRLGKDQAALKDYSKAIAMSLANAAPNPTTDDIEQLSTIYYSRAKLYIKNKDYEKALSDCNKLVELDPQDKYRACRANVFDKLGQHEQANAERKEVIEPYTQAIKEKATDTTYNDRGVAYEDLGLYKDALQDYIEALKLNPTESIYLSNCACMFGRLGEYDKAISLFAQAAQLDGSQSGKASYYAGTAHDQILAGKPQAAIDSATQALQFDASNQDAYHWRSEANKMLGKFEPARNDADLALRFEYDPDN